MIRTRFGRVVLLALALGLFALEVAAFASVANTAKRFGGARPYAGFTAARVASRVLVGNAARGAERLAAGAATGFVIRTTRLAALALGSTPSAQVRNQVHARKMIRLVCPRPAVSRCQVFPGPAAAWKAT